MTMSEQIESVLFDVPIFKGLDDKGRMKLINSGSRFSYNPGESLFLEHSQTSNFFIVESGRVKLRKVSSSGHEVVLHLAGPGHLIGCTALVSPEKLYSLDAIAFEKLTVIRFCRQQFLEAISGKPELLINLLSDLSNRLDDIYANRETMHRPVPQRIAALLIKQALPPDVASREWTCHPLGEVKMTKSQVALFVGTTTETATRILSKWKKRGLIESARGRLSLLDPAGIYEMSRGLLA